jgi:hypothetical protein
MFSAIQRSYTIFRQSLSVLRQDKEILIFPLLSGIFTIIAMAGLIFGGTVTGFFSASPRAGIGRWRGISSGMPLSSSGIS